MTGKRLHAVGGHLASYFAVQIQENQLLMLLPRLPLNRITMCRPRPDDYSAKNQQLPSAPSNRTNQNKLFIQFPNFFIFRLAEAQMVANNDDMWKVFLPMYGAIRKLSIFLPFHRLSFHST